MNLYAQSLLIACDTYPIHPHIAYSSAFHPTILSDTIPDLLEFICFILKIAAIVNIIYLGL